MVYRKDMDGWIRVNKLLLIIPFLFLGCDGGINIMYSSSDTYFVCGDSIALNYDYGAAGQYSNNTSECVYCTDLYFSEQERYDNCCCTTGALNFNSSCSSSDQTYCIWE